MMLFPKMLKCRSQKTFYEIVNLTEEKFAGSHRMISYRPANCLSKLERVKSERMCDTRYKRFRTGVNRNYYHLLDAVFMIAFILRHFRLIDAVKR